MAQPPPGMDEGIALFPANDDTPCDLCFETVLQGDELATIVGSPLGTVWRDANLCPPCASAEERKIKGWRCFR